MKKYFSRDSRLFFLTISFVICLASCSDYLNQVFNMEAPDVIDVTNNSEEEINAIKQHGLINPKAPSKLIFSGKPTDWSYTASFKVDRESLDLFHRYDGGENSTNHFAFSDVLVAKISGIPSGDISMLHVAIKKSDWSITVADTYVAYKLSGNESFAVAVELPLFENMFMFSDNDYVCELYYETALNEQKVEINNFEISFEKKGNYGFLIKRNPWNDNGNIEHDYQHRINLNYFNLPSTYNENQYLNVELNFRCYNSNIPEELFIELVDTEEKVNWWAMGGFYTVRMNGGYNAIHCSFPIDFPKEFTGNFQTASSYLTIGYGRNAYDGEISLDNMDISCSITDSPLYSVGGGDDPVDPVNPSIPTGLVGTFNDNGRNYIVYYLNAGETVAQLLDAESGRKYSIYWCDKYVQTSLLSAYSPVVDAKYTVLDPYDRQITSIDDDREICFTAEYSGQYRIQLETYGSSSGYCAICVEESGSSRESKTVDVTVIFPEYQLSQLVLNANSTDYGDIIFTVENGTEEAVYTWVLDNTVISNGSSSEYTLTADQISSLANGLHEMFIIDSNGNDAVVNFRITTGSDVAQFGKGNYIKILYPESPLNDVVITQNLNDDGSITFTASSDLYDLQQFVWILDNTRLGTDSQTITLSSYELDELETGFHSLTVLATSLSNVFDAEIKITISK